MSSSAWSTPPWRLRLLRVRARAVVHVEDVEPPLVYRQAAPEVGEIPRVSWRPRNLGEREQPRKDHVFDVLRGALVLGPDLALRAQDVRGLLGRQRRRDRLERIHGIQRQK